MLFMDPFRLMSEPLTRPAAFLPSADITVSDTDIVLTLDVPGLADKDLSIELFDGHLIVSGERPAPELAEGTTFVHTERPFGRFERRIKVPDGVDPEKIMASISNGVLSLIVPKPEKLRPRTVQISSSRADQRELEAAAA